MTLRAVHIVMSAVQILAVSTTAIAQMPHIQLTMQDSGADVLLISVSLVDDRVVWASGAGGTVVRTLDGGMEWTSMTVPGADTLQFRDVHGVDENTAYVMSAGVESASRIYKTTDGGATWILQFVNPGPGGFFDCFDFWDENNGIAFSDSHDDRFILIRTTDGGVNWIAVPARSLPAASDGEGSFAASGTCLQTVGDSTVVIGTGAGASARLLRSDDRGDSWSAFETPVTAGTPTSGISSVSFIDDDRGYAFGLELSGTDEPIQNAIRTDDGGTTWAVLSPPQLPDVYGGAVVPDTDPPMLVVTGPKGIDYSPDGGDSWISLTKLDHWGVAFAGPQVGWAVGPGGRLTKMTVVPKRP